MSTVWMLRHIEVQTNMNNQQVLFLSSLLHLMDWRMKKHTIIYGWLYWSESLLHSKAAGEEDRCGCRVKTWQNINSRQKLEPWTETSLQLKGEIEAKNKYIDWKRDRSLMSAISWRNESHDCKYHCCHRRKKPWPEISVFSAEKWRKLKRRASHTRQPESLSLLKAEVHHHTDKKRC